MYQQNDEMVFEVLHLFCGSGGAALGMQQSSHQYKGLNGRFHTVLGIDNDPYCCTDFERLTGASAACMDLFSREQYIAFHGKQPSEDWGEVTPKDIRKVCRGIYPDVVFLSPPCKGFSGLLPEKTAKSKKYQALNQLTIRSIGLTLEAFKEDLPAVIMLENVPRIRSRGKELLKEIKVQLKLYGYEIVARQDEIHDCGELAGLGQTRKRYLLIARNPKKLPSFIYQPPKQRLKSIGEVLGPLPKPGDIKRAGAMHRIPKLAWKTWERLALIPAGKDWRALNDLNYTPRAGAFRIVPWEQVSPTVTAATKGPGQSNGVSAVADPRLEFVQGYGNKYRVVGADGVAPTVTGSRLGSGALIYADKKVPQFAANASKVHRWNEASGTITGGAGVSNGGLVVSDPRLPKREKRYSGIYKVIEWGKAASTVIGQTDIQSGALSVSDARFGCKQRSGTMKVTPWDETAKTITSGNIYNSASAVADPRIPSPDEQGVFIIIAADGTWHRPLTTFEMAMLQGLPSTYADGSPLVFSGNSDARWREHIGNMVPPPTATAIGNALLETMMVNFMGDWHWGFSDDVIWVSGERKESIPYRAKA